MTWSILLPSGEYLDTPPDFSLQFELNNQVFSTSDTSVLPGSFSFPVDVPLTKQMKAQLNHPHRVDNASRFSRIDGVWVYAGGIPMFFGTLTIMESSENSVRITMISNPASALKETKLPQVDLGGARVVSPGTWENLMKDTVDYPEAYDYIFMPVRQEEGVRYWNFWKSDTEEFIVASSTVTPFVKLKYLLGQMFQLIPDWSFVNDWQAEDLELGRLYVFNNADARVITDDSPPTIGLPDAFLLSKHLPDILCVEFLKKLVAQWGLGLFANIFTKTIKIAALRDVLRAAAKHDWTDYALSDLKISAAGDVPGYYNYKQHDTVPAEMPAVEIGYFWNTLAEYIVLEGYTYIETTSSKWHFDGISENLFLGKFFLGVRVGNGPDYQAGMEAIFDYQYTHLWRGDWSGLYLDDGEYKLEKTDYPVALMFYRGIQAAPSDGYNIPINGNTPWLDGGSPGDKSLLVTGGVTVGESSLSLNWQRENGLYEKFHKTWAEMLRNGKPITQSFVLPITELRTFSFEDKIRICNTDFFAKRLKIQKLLDRGRVLIEASLISVI